MPRATANPPRICCPLLEVNRKRSTINIVEVAAVYEPDCPIIPTGYMFSGDSAAGSDILVLRGGSYTGMMRDGLFHFVSVFADPPILAGMFIVVVFSVTRSAFKGCPIGL